MDSGTTWNVTFFPQDFIGNIKPVPDRATLTGITWTLPVTGVGILECHVVDNSFDQFEAPDTWCLIYTDFCVVPKSIFAKQMGVNYTYKEHTFYFNGRMVWH